MTQLRHLAAGALLLASTALPSSSSAGFKVEEHLVQAAGRTYVEAVIHASSAQELSFALSTPNHGPLYPAVISFRSCDQATACHYRFDVSGRTAEGKPICPRASLTVKAVEVGWWGFVRSTSFSDSFSVC
jgi:hypothetical protein